MGHWTDIEVKNLGTTIWQILIMIIDLGETSQDDKSSGQVWEIKDYLSSLKVSQSY